MRFSSPHIYGMHEKCPEHILVRGWLKEMAQVGDGGYHPGVDFTPTWERGIGSILRIQYKWGGGTIPLRDNLQGYLASVRSCLENSMCVSVIEPFNEPNHPHEWVDGPYSVDYVVEVFDRLYELIHSIPGYEDATVLLPALAPWIVEPGVPWWLGYFAEFIDKVKKLDGVSLHTYSRGSSDPSRIWAQDKMKWPYQEQYNGFLTFTNFMELIPTKYQALPVIITETNQGDREWDFENTGWVKAAYRCIDDWNKTPGNQKIHALVLYRWPGYDKWHIWDKPGVQLDFLEAQAEGYKVEDDMSDWQIALAEGYEGAFYNWSEELRVNCPEGWAPAWIQGPGDGVLHRPEYDRDDEHQRSGAACAKITTRHATHDGCLFRRVSVKPGDEIRLTASAALWHDECGHGVRIGLHLGGIVLPNQMTQEMFDNLGVTWNDTWWAQWDSDWEPELYKTMSMIAVPPSDHVTIVLHSRCKYKASNIVAFWDDVLLEQRTFGGPTIPTTTNELLEALLREVVIIRKHLVV